MPRTTKASLLLAVLFMLSSRLQGQKIEYTFEIPNDTTRNYYVTVFPKGQIKGSIIILPGFGELPKETLIECDLYKHASEAGYLTIIPALGDWSFFYMDGRSHQKLNHFINQLFSKHNLDERTFFMGGLSLGGTMALQYAQRAYTEKSTLKKPVAVFAIDPPLDIERLYHCMTTKNRPAKHPVSIQEDNYVVNRIRQEFKTDPKSNPEYFWTISPYAQTDTSHTSLKSILSLPLRIYNEPDIHWYLENRKADYNCMNVIDSAAMINWLRALGNMKAELITTSGKGHRIKNKLRHPHSWSIADGHELVAWINANCYQP